MLMNLPSCSKAGEEANRERPGRNLECLILHRERLGRLLGWVDTRMRLGRIRVWDSRTHLLDRWVRECRSHTLARSWLMELWMRPQPPWVAEAVGHPLRLGRRGCRLNVG